MKNKYKIALFVLIFLFVIGFLAYIRYFNSFHNLPILLDEVTDLSQIKLILNEKAIVKQVAVSGENIPNYPNNSFYHLLLSLPLFLGSSIFSFNFLYVLIAGLICLVFFLFLYKLTKNYYISLISLVLFPLIRSTPSILGIHFLTRFVFSLLFLFLALYLFLKLDELNYNLFIAFIFVFFILFLLYPPSALFLFLLLIVWKAFFIKQRFRISYYLKNKKIKWTLSILLIVLIIASLIVFGRVHLSTFVSQFLFYKSLTVYNDFSFFSIYGILPLILSFVGLLVSYNEKWSRFFLSWLIICFTEILLFYFVGFSIFIRFQRVLYLTIIGLIPFTSLGIYFILNKIYSFFRKVKLNKIISLLLILALFLSFVSSLYFSFPKQVGQKPIDEQEYNDLLWLKNNYNEKKIVTYPGVSPFLYILTNNQARQARPAYADWYINEFFDLNCDEKMKIIDKEKIDLVYSLEEQECDFLKLVYSGKCFIYEVR